MCFQTQLVPLHSGARVELRVPLQRQHAEIREGDEVGLYKLCTS
jgi:hypothetical protein